MLARVVMRMVYASAYGIRFVDLVKTRRCGVADRGEPVLTPGIASAWGASVREPKGRRRLSLTKIVDAGVALATRDGLASVSMGRLAASSGRRRCRCIGTWQTNRIAGADGRCGGRTRARHAKAG